MKILGLTLGHDSAITSVENGKLQHTLEASSLSGYKRGAYSLHRILLALTQQTTTPDVVAVAGAGTLPYDAPYPLPSIFSAGYTGLASKITDTQILGHAVKVVAVPHELSHLMCSYALSPWADVQDVYALLWEGSLGGFYRISRHGICTELSEVVIPKFLGEKYRSLYLLASGEDQVASGTAAGKLMAKIAYVDPEIELLASDTEIMDDFLKAEELYEAEDNMHEPPKRFRAILQARGWHVDNPYFLALCKYFSDKALSAVLDTITKYLAKDAEFVLGLKLPLVIAGGCGLNCDWNTAIRNSNIFTEVFVPPCTDDSGITVGAIAEAQRLLTGKVAISWTVYGGHPVTDLSSVKGYTREDYDADKVAKFLLNGSAVGYVRGSGEIGPRALGHRSILATAHDPKMPELLNRIKRRESFRPVAPMVLEEDVELYFDWVGPSPHMLYFQQVKEPARFPAITHVDGTARVQTVGPDGCPMLRELLLAYKAISGDSVLCNTSLNYPNRGYSNDGFLNARFCTDHNLKAFVIGDSLFVRDNK